MKNLVTLAILIVLLFAAFKAHVNLPQGRPTVSTIEGMPESPSDVLGKIKYNAALAVMEAELAMSPVTTQELLITRVATVRVGGEERTFIATPFKPTWTLLNEE